MLQRLCCQSLVTEVFPGSASDRFRAAYLIRCRLAFPMAPWPSLYFPIAKLQIGINDGIPRVEIERFSTRDRCNTTPVYLGPLTVSVSDANGSSCVQFIYHSSARHFFPPLPFLPSPWVSRPSLVRSALGYLSHYPAHIAALMAHRASEMARRGSEMAHTIPAPRHRRPRSMASALHRAARPSVGIERTGCGQGGSQIMHIAPVQIGPSALNPPFISTRP